MQSDMGDIHFTLHYDPEIDLRDIVAVLHVDMYTCYESFPCQHHVEVRLRSGQVVASNYFSGSEILYLLEKFDMPIPEHFETYREHCRYQELASAKEGNFLDGKGERFNEGKTRHDLVPAFAQEQYARVLTVGAKKYGERNWERGMKWTTVLASLKRHTVAFEQGEDYDPETGLLHTAHIMCNAAFLSEYYRIYPQGDDRPHPYRIMTKIGLDIDEVLADWIGHYTNRFGLQTPESWNFDKCFNERLLELKDNKDFWMTIPPKISPKEIPFEPHCYITSRGVPTEWTEEWLMKNGFPSVPVHTVGVGESKVQVARDSKIDWFVDDRYANFVQLNNAGICCFLFDAPHNRRYDVGFKRIASLEELCGFKK